MLVHEDHATHESKDHVYRQVLLKIERSRDRLLCQVYFHYIQKLIDPWGKIHVVSFYIHYHWKRNYNGSCPSVFCFTTGCLTGSSSLPPYFLMNIPHSLTESICGVTFNWWNASNSFLSSSDTSCSFEPPPSYDNWVTYISSFISILSSYHYFTSISLCNYKSLYHYISLSPNTTQPKVPTLEHTTTLY